MAIPDGLDRPAFLHCAHQTIEQLAITRARPEEDSVTDMLVLALQERRVKQRCERTRNTSASARHTSGTHRSAIDLFNRELAI